MTKPAGPYVNVREPNMSGVVAEHGMTIWVDKDANMLCIGIYETDDSICFSGRMPLVFAQMIASYGEALDRGNGADGEASDARTA